MESKQTILTVLISSVVALVVSVFFSVVSIQYSPQTSVSQTNQTNLSLPDLIVDSSGYRVIGMDKMNQSNGSVLYRVEVTATVKNIGQNKAGPSYVSFTAYNGDYFRFGLSPIGPLDVGQSAKAQFLFSLPADNYFLLSIADYFNRVRESDEYNNYDIINMTVA